jgi:hypothetical protein
MFFVVALTVAAAHDVYAISVTIEQCVDVAQFSFLALLFKCRIIKS